MDTGPNTDEGSQRAQTERDILLIEDDTFVQAIVNHHLSSRGYRVWVASDPMEARSLMDLHADTIRLLIVDSGLPVQSGESVAEELKERFGKTRVLMISGYPKPESVPDAYPFLQKPFTGEELANRVEALLGE